MFWNKKEKKDPVLDLLKGLSDKIVNLSDRLENIERKTAEIVFDESPVKEDLEPHVSLLGTDVDDQGNVKIQLDWNDAFVAKLRASGFDGVEEEVIVQKWLAKLANDINLKLMSSNSTFS